MLRAGGSFVHRLLALASTTAALLVINASNVSAQGGDVTVFLGGAYPVYDERLTFRLATPALPGVDVDVDGSPAVAADGGLVFGGALTFEFGVFGIEGRLDATDVGFDITGARFNLRGARPPFEGATGVITIGDGESDKERLYLLSINGRLRTPGTVGIFVSGGLSYLPQIEISGSVPVSVQIGGFPALDNEALRLSVVRGDAEDRWGFNGGGGIRIGAGRVGFIAEARVFYFREFELNFSVDESFPQLNLFLEGLDPVGFNPIIVNAQAGLLFRF
jgi:hypothetical protein